jgi:hypothetical protein
MVTVYECEEYKLIWNVDKRRFETIYPDGYTGELTIARVGWFDLEDEALDAIAGLVEGGLHGLDID